MSIKRCVPCAEPGGAGGHHAGHTQLHPEGPGEEEEEEEPRYTNKLTLVYGI